MSDLMKTCRACEREKSFNAFRASRNMADGHLSKCKACEAKQRKHRRECLTAGVLREVLHYAPETGVFTRIVDASNMMAGSVAGYENDQGYIIIAVNGAQYHAHRLAWLYMTGDWPSQQIDHKNRDKGDNRWSNLRLATPAQNGQNSTIRKSNRAGIKGVGWSKVQRMWRARIVIEGKERHLGYFRDIESAQRAYADAAARHFGEFARIA